METKPGYLTTEFWTTVFTSLLGVAQMATGAVNVNNKWIALAMAIVVGLYNASRGIAKVGQPYKPVLKIDGVTSITPTDTSQSHVASLEPDPVPPATESVPPIPPTA